MAASNSKTGPSFCKLLIDDDDCTSMLQIPSEFVKSYGDVLPPNATLKIDKSGKCWRVGIEKFHDRYFFTDGWKEFAQNVDLKSLEYLSFKFVGLSPFHASADEMNGSRSVSKNENGDHLTDQAGGSAPIKMWKFVKELKKHHANRMDIPKSFAIGTGIAKDMKMVLQDEKGRKWPVRVTDRKCGQFAMTAGWPNFVIGNNLVIGSTISFEFVSCLENTVKTQVIKEGTNEKELLGSVKRRGGRLGFFVSDKTIYHFTEQENDFGVERKWRFSKELKEHHFAHRLDIPKEFAIGTGIARNREIKLRDEKGRNWTVHHVMDMKCGQFALSSGWRNFLIDNKVVVGSAISFEFVPTSSDYILETRVTKRGRGRPPSRVFIN
ncbi:hypothetical protein ACJIZ3_008128 [Penstemon smallii]|uniref:TF-B3 domain-containing protein n=1 Tax=Penstemon smallii TaxID=265156 RepID=A0ABD3TAL5_9LAMI